MLPVLVLVLAMAVWVLAAVGDQLRCTDAAGVAARATARGDSAEQVRSAGRAAAPAGAQVRVRVSGDLVEVSVHSRVQPLAGVLGGLPALEVSGRAVAAREDAVAPPDAALPASAALPAGAALPPGVPLVPGVALPPDPGVRPGPRGPSQARSLPGSGSPAGTGATGAAAGGGRP